MHATSPLSRRRSVLTVLAAVFAAGAAYAGDGALEGEWGGLDAHGETAQVMVTSDKILGFFWGGDYQDAGPSHAYDGGARIEFTFRAGAATLVKTPAGARLTIREGGHAPNSIDLKKD